MPAIHEHTNRLAHETSPYLLQHAHNPVDWYPWGDEAIAAAGEQDKPIFLSIGYSACHWCHVMEHESFENDDIAALMNQWFINVKVDREERPDLDQIYMNAVVAMTGQGGWPMSVFLSPDLKPFFGGTYWPPEQRWGRPGFREVLAGVHDAWQNRRDAVLQQGTQLTAAVIQMGMPHDDSAQLTADILQAAGRSLVRSADRTHGGFGGAPKFPHPMDLRVLLRVWQRFGNSEALDVVRLTLDKMSRGGIYDHLGGGFHRYSTDARWLVPHFEKMLYDNALLVPGYLEAYQAMGNADYARVVGETLDYVLREMTQPEGGFYSTQDADSEGVEGKFFVWNEDEIIEALGPHDARIFNYYFDVTREGNWEEHNILNRPKPHDEAARALKLPEHELALLVERCKQILLERRSHRIAPGRDDKVLASWNGLMIYAMSMAAQILNEPRYAQAAREAADFILEQMRDDDGRLLHSYKDGRARFNAYLDDYACLTDGLVELYHATFDARYLTSALELAERMIERFHDPERGGFFYTSADHETLIARYKDSQDNATPSGNGMAATALLRLARLCGRSDLETRAVETLNLLSGQLSRAPMAGGQSLIALDFLLGPAWEIAIAEGAGLDEARQVHAALHRPFLPNKVLARRPHATPDEELPAPLRPLLEGRASQNSGTTLYMCQHGTCGLPVVGVEALTEALRKL